MKLRAIDAILSQQALIVGVVQDTLTGKPPLYPPLVELFYQTPPRRYPLLPRVLPDGQFVFAGHPATTFPRLGAGEELALRLTASATGYQAASSDFVLTAAMLQPTPRVIEIEGVSKTVELPDAPLVQRPFALQPLPVHLSGRVVDADNRETPLAGAQVQITLPAARGPVATTADGFFTLPNLPVALEVTVQVAHTGFTTLTQVIRLDYRTPVNQQLFALTA